MTMVIILIAACLIVAGVAFAKAIGWRPIDEWWQILLRSATSWVSVGLGGAVGLVAAHWMILLGILPFMPLWLQLPLAIIVGALAIGGPVIMARISDQPKLKSRVEARKNEVV